MAAPTLNPEEQNYFSGRRRQVTDTYNLSSAQNTYQQGATSRAFQRGVGDLARNYGRMREKMPWGYGAKGLLNSGIYQKGLTDLATDGWVRPLSNAMGEYGDQMGAFQLSQQQLSSAYQGGMNDLNETERARLAMRSVADMIRGSGAS